VSGWLALDHFEASGGQEQDQSLTEQPMPYDPKRRDSTWTMIVPGAYMDPTGAAHIFPDEICATLGWPYTQENYDLIVNVTRDMLLEKHPDMILRQIKHERGADA
jgi:hypothetical protein